MHHAVGRVLVLADEQRAVDRRHLRATARRGRREGDGEAWTARQVRRGGGGEAGREERLGPITASTYLSTPICFASSQVSFFLFTRVNRRLGEEKIKSKRKGGY